MFINKILFENLSFFRISIIFFIRLLTSPIIQSSLDSCLLCSYSSFICSHLRLICIL